MSAHQEPLPECIEKWKSQEDKNKIMNDHMSSGADYRRKIDVSCEKVDHLEKKTSNLEDSLEIAQQILERKIDRVIDGAWKWGLANIFSILIACVGFAFWCGGIQKAVTVLEESFKAHIERIAK